MHPSSIPGAGATIPGAPLVPLPRAIFLDYLRIFAFVSVLVGHKFIGYLEYIASLAGWGSIAALPARFLIPFVRDGGVGVVVFFLVSGYIITQVLRTEQTGEFLVKRAFRIYPLYACAVLLQYCAMRTTGSAPDIITLIQQLSLAGDLFRTPYALKGVEWTLRVEMVFYLLMALFKQVGLFKAHLRLLPAGLLGAALTCALVSPVPDTGGWSHGYLTIYGPFLLLGSCFYLFQCGAISLQHLCAGAAIGICINYSLLIKYKPNSVDAHFGALACAVFVSAWLARDRIPRPVIVLFFSELTYAVYLFHNWAFDYFKYAFVKWALMSNLAADICALVALLSLCAIAVRLIERPGIGLGRRLSKMSPRTWIP